MSRPELFISYKRDHQVSTKVIQEIEKELNQDFVLLRDANMEVGKRWTYELNDWLLRCDAAIIILSKEANDSNWCRREWTVLVARWNVKGIPVIPVCVESNFFKTGILDDIQGTKWIISTDNYIEKIKSALKNISSQERTTDDYLAAHRAWLSWQYHDAPVFRKEPYALADVYIEPGCGVLEWGQIKNDKKDPFAEDVLTGGRKPMLETVLELMGNPKFSDLITIQAGPGAGKSAFTHRLASTLIDEGLQPILVRFRDLRFSTFSSVDKLLDDAIRIGFSDEDSPNPDPDTKIISALLEERVRFREADICKTVIILDGWDEVSLTGNESLKAQLSTWLPKIRDYFINKRGVKVRTILTGRPSGEVSHRGILENTTPILTMRHMRPKQLTQYAQNISLYLNGSQKNSDKETGKIDWTINLDILKPLFEQYNKWFNNMHDQYPDSTGDFLGNPLLAYLSFRVFSETDKSPQELISNPTSLYHELINITVDHAGKAQDEKLKDSAHRGGENLRRLLQEAAATISMLRRESVSFTELEARLEESKLPVPENLLNKWRELNDTESALQELVINFYFKGGNKHLGCEFLHKSFREYLFAEAIFFALLDAANDQRGLFEPCKTYKYWEDFDFDTSEYHLSRRLGYLLSPQWLTSEVRAHLFGLIENNIETNLDKWKWLRDALLSIYAWWAEGALLRHQPTRSRALSRWEKPYVDALFQQVIPFDSNEDLAPIRTSVLDSHLGHALIQITAFIFDKLSDHLDTKNKLKKRELAYCSESDNKFYFRPGGEGFFRTLIARFSTEGWGENGISNMFLAKVNLVNENSEFLIACECDFNGANLRNAKLGKANLSNVNLKNADLVSADLGGVKLDGANLSFAEISDANLRNADLRRINLFGTKLIFARLCGADLREARLNGADLSGANLKNANLKNAYLNKANLSNVDLKNADLGYADLSRTNLNNADLGNANLSGANLSGANLSGTILSNADLSDAVLTGVIGYNPK